VDNGCVYTGTAHIYVDLDVQSLENEVGRYVTFEIEGVAEPVLVVIDFSSAGDVYDLDLMDPAYDGAAQICATEGHTLTTSVDLTWDGCEADAYFVVDDKLMAGDFSNRRCSAESANPGAPCDSNDDCENGVCIEWVSQDNLVDITDFAILFTCWNQQVDPDLGTLADATGDGLHNVADFTAIQANFGVGGDVCDSTMIGSGPSEPSMNVAPEARFRIPVEELPIPNAEDADRNGDGMINTLDIHLFAEEHGLVLTPEFRAKLDWIDSAVLGNVSIAPRDDGITCVQP